MIPPEFQFLRPLWLLALLPLAAAVVWLARQQPGVRRWAEVVDAHLAPHVLIAGAAARSRFVSLAVGIAGALAVLALAGPAWQQLPQPVFSSDDALVVMLDLSQSMNTQDVAPSRLERARFKIADLLEQRDEGQTALLAFAAEAFVVSPLTDDTETIVAQLSALTPDLMPSQGTRVDRALNKAQELLQQSGMDSGQLLLVGDDVNADRALSVAQALVAEGYQLSVLGVGTTEGGPVPGRKGFLKDRSGAIVVAGLERDALRELALSGGGIYQDLSPDDRDIEQLSRIFDRVRPGEVSERDLTADLWREEGPWLLLPLLPLAALIFRQRVLFVVALIGFLPILPVHAVEADALWLNPDQRAARALADGDASRAAELFADSEWRGVASYRAGDYEASLEALAEIDDIDATYNRGNALARLGRFEEAIAAYDSVLERDPDNEDAKFNRDLLMQQQNEQQQQGDGEPGEEGEQDPSQQQDGQSGEESESGEEQQQSSSDSSGDDQQQDAGEQQAEEAAEGTELTEQQKRDIEQAQAEERAAEQAEEQAREQGEEGSPESLAAAEQQPDESEQAVEQWLRRIPDDPGGLLRRKFLYQYRRQEQPAQEQEQW